MKSLLLALLSFIVLSCSVEQPKCEEIDGLKVEEEPSKFSEEIPNDYTGLVKECFDNGKIKTLAEIENGELNGFYKVWYETGQLRFEGHTKNGEEHGLSSKWYENGQLKSQSEYVNGKQVSYKSWDAKGRLIKDKVLN